MGWSTADIPDLDGRVAVVTGANGGLGLATTRELARKGAHVVMAVRNLEKAATARNGIHRTVPSASLELVALDLGSLASVKQAATVILAAHATIDILVNNAGVMGIPYRTTGDGFEMQFGTNHLGHFALTAWLMPALLHGSAARVVTITSTARLLGSTVDPSDLSMKEHYNAWRSYGRAKLANAQFTVELDRRLRAAGARVRALAADPGFSHTDLQANSAREARGLSHRFFDRTVGWIGTSPTHGALPQLRAATDPIAKGGELYGLRFVIAGPPVRNPYLGRSMRPRDLATLWQVSEQATGVRLDIESLLGQAGSW